MAPIQPFQQLVSPPVIYAPSIPSMVVETLRSKSTANY